MDPFIEFFIAFALGWFIGSKVTALFQLQAFKQILQDLGVKNKDLRALLKNNDMVLPEHDSEHAEMAEHEIIIERHGSELYAFRADNNEFLGQGSDREALIKRIAERYSNVRFTVKDGAEHIKSEA